MNKRKRYYVQRMMQQEQVSKDILNSYYKTECVTNICELIKQEIKRYTEKLQG